LMTFLDVDWVQVTLAQVQVRGLLLDLVLWTISTWTN
jgi:hypothetical protein